MKVVINSCYGGFGLSYKGVMAYAKEKGIKVYAYIDEKTESYLKQTKIVEFKGKTKEPMAIYYTTKRIKTEADLNTNYFSYRDIAREDPALVKTVEKLGKEANGSCSDLTIVEIPDDVKWTIDDYDGLESVEEEHRSWN